MALDDELRSRGFGGGGSAGRRPALVVVDATRGFTDPGSPLACDADEAVAAIGRLAEGMRAAGLPVVYSTVVVGEAERQSAAFFLEKMPGLLAIADNPSYSEIDPRIAPAEGEPVLAKIFPSVFFGTQLGAILAARGVDTVIVTGMSTSGCVRATAVDALQYGYRVAVVPEAVADRDPGAAAATLRDLSLKYADVVPLADALTYVEEVGDAA
jgi:nicotinamidase-related amidase